MGNCSGSEISHSEATSSINPSYSTRPSTREATTSCTGQSWFSAGISEAPFSPGEILSSPNLKIYTYADLKNTTRNFSRDLLLGVGGFGNVFKGWVNKKTLAPTKVGTGMIVAIKSWNPHSTQGYEQWQSEVNFLGRISHPNLVKLLGYCWEDKKLLLVYEFMQKGSLSQHLFRSRSSVAEPLSWGARIKIAIGAAKGLHFLHTSERQVIYRDFKTSNVLLDGDYNAKISDFGLAKPGPIGGMSHVTTRVMGTWGYTAPEYMATGRLYVKSDVYSFGVVLLEMMTGLSVFEVHRKTEEQILVDWVKNLLNQTEKLESIMDPGIEGQYSSKAARRFARLTQTCLESEHKERPSMEEVIQVLENIEAINVKLDITKEEKKKMRIRFYLCN